MTDLVVDNIKKQHEYCTDKKKFPQNRPIFEKICQVAKMSFLTLGAALMTAAAITALCGVMTPVVCGVAIAAIISAVIGVGIAIFQRCVVTETTLKEDTDIEKTDHPIVDGPLDVMDKHHEFNAHKHVLYRSAIDHYKQLGLKPCYTIDRLTKEGLASFRLTKSEKPKYFSNSLMHELGDFKPHSIQFHSDFFDYQGGDNAYTLDFANQYLGGGALGNGFVQEELMCTEFPELANYIAANIQAKGRYRGRCQALTRYRGEGMKLAHGVKEGSPSPVIFKNLQRVQEVKGVYGRNLYSVNPSDLKADHIHLLPQAQKANILAVAAAKLNESFPDAIRKKLAMNESLTAEQKQKVLEIQTSVDAIEDYYNTFFAGISLADDSTDGDTIIHSGKLGCGVFGNNTRVCLVLQMIAAQEADVELHLFGISQKEQKQAEADFTAVMDEAKKLRDIKTPEALFKVVSKVMYKRLSK